MTSAKFLIPLLYILAIATIFVVGQEIRVGFYESSCPEAESIVNSVVSSNYESDKHIAARLVRLMFHDCFVRGCDASLLLDGSNTEKASRNNEKLAGFEIIDEIKTQLEEQCPGIVSCSDILSFAARDSVKLTNGPSYNVPAGRRDGRVSIKTEADNLPGFGDTIAVQKKKFAAKGLDTHDLVTLVGAHTIGTTSCESLGNRLYNFNRTGNADPSINPSFLPQLQSICPMGVDRNKRLPLDTDSVFESDTSFFKNIQNSRGVILSDQRLWSDDSTKPVVEGFLGIEGSSKQDFYQEFAKAMVKLGNVEVLTGNKGEIRRVCSAVNQ